MTGSHPSRSAISVGSSDQRVWSPAHMRATASRRARSDAASATRSATGPRRSRSITRPTLRRRRDFGGGRRREVDGALEVVLGVGQRREGGLVRARREGDPPVEHGPEEPAVEAVGHAGGGLVVVGGRRGGGGQGPQ